MDMFNIITLTIVVVAMALCAAVVWVTCQFMKDTQGQKIAQPNKDSLIDVWGTHVPTINKQPATVLNLWDTSYL